jgi:hypothetical protein
LQLAAIPSLVGGSCCNVSEWLDRHGWLSTQLSA